MPTMFQVSGNCLSEYLKQTDFYEYVRLSIIHLSILTSINRSVYPIINSLSPLTVKSYIIATSPPKIKNKGRKKKKSQQTKQIKHP